MDLEQLQAIAEIVQSLSGDAKEAFVVYVIVAGMVPCIKGLLAALTISFAVFLVARLIKGAIKTCSLAGKIAGALDYPRQNGDWHNKDVDVLCDYLRQHRQSIQPLMGRYWAMRKKEGSHRSEQTASSP